ncbi:GDP-mannose 4,6-dehydratase [Geobacillus zalihae]|nr:GDP-mannose 4,6-dehydratase [Geobacillus zalihae]
MKPVEGRSFVRVGDCTKAKEKLGWEQEVSFEELAKMMVDADLERISEI